MNAVVLFPISPVLMQFGETAHQIVEDAALAQEAIAAAMDELWGQVLGGGLYAAITDLGTFFAVGTLLLFAVKWTQALIDSDNPRAFSEAIWPLLVIALLANNGALLADSTLALRSILNETNQLLLDSTSASVRLQEAFERVQADVAAEGSARGLLAQCSSYADPQQRNDCLDRVSQQLETLAASAPKEGVLQRLLEAARQGQTNPVGLALQTFDINPLQTAVRGWLIAFGVAFQWVVEISLLLTGLLGPLAVGGSLLPVGQKAIYAWLIGFFSVGMVKISFNIIAGLVATLVVNAGENDPLIFAFAVGLLAPLLAMVLSAGAGMAIFNSLGHLVGLGLGAIAKSK
ncbi:hypothetical protein [Lusitaniella coriacea]|uniref:hypothetical protein n=1 Tax=Lusitaniella coriacea TaxID=1983105 RepID=UPI003CF8D29B